MTTTTKLAALLALALSGCLDTSGLTGGLAYAPDAGELAADLREASGDARREPSPDLLEPVAAPDLLEPAAPDLRPIASPDLSPAPDLLACGRAGQPCCGLSCSEAGAICLVDGDLCASQLARECVRVGSIACGKSGQPPCDDAGKPSPAGRCEAGLTPWSSTTGVKCVACG